MFLVDTSIRRVGALDRTGGAASRPAAAGEADAEPWALAHDDQSTINPRCAERLTMLAAPCWLPAFPATWGRHSVRASLSLALVPKMREFRSAEHGGCPMSRLVRLPLRRPLVLHRRQPTLLASRGLRAWQQRRPQVPEA